MALLLHSMEMWTCSWRCSFYCCFMGKLHFPQWNHTQTLIECLYISEHLCTSWLHGWSGSHKFWVLSPFTYHRTNPHHPSTRWMKTLWSELVHASCYIAQFKCVHNTAVSIQSAICAGPHTHVNQPASRKRGNLMVWLGKHALKVCSKSPSESSSPTVIMISRMQKATIRWEFKR